MIFADGGCAGKLESADGHSIDGHALEESEVLANDPTRWTAKWKTMAAAPTDRPVKVVLAMKQARLYSLAVGEKTER